MNILLWAFQVLAALLYTASGVMKAFMFDKISQDVPSFGALPREAWKTLGILELLCAVGLIVPAALDWQPWLTSLAAMILAVEMDRTERPEGIAEGGADCRVLLAVPVHRFELSHGV